MIATEHATSYIEDSAKSASDLAAEIIQTVKDCEYDGITTIPHGGGRKVEITVTVKEVK